MPAQPPGPTVETKKGGASGQDIYGGLPPVQQLPVPVTPAALKRTDQAPQQPPEPPTGVAPWGGEAWRGNPPASLTGPPPANTALGGTAQAFGHGFTFGADEHVIPFLAAGMRHLATGEPFSSAYADVQHNMRLAQAGFAEQHPWVNAGAEIAGIAASPVNKLFGPLYEGADAIASGAKMLSPVWQKALSVAARIPVSAGEGATAAATMSHAPWGGEQWRHEAAEGGYWGGGLGLAGPFFARMLRGLWHSMTPGQQVERHAGETLEKSASHPNVPPEQPRAGVPFDAASAQNDPGLAATTRRSNTLNDAAAKDLEARQTKAVRDAIDRLGGTGMKQPEASESLAKGMRGAHDVMDDEIKRLWNTRAMRGVRPSMKDVRQTIADEIKQMPVADQLALRGNEEAREIIGRLNHMPDGATTLADLNSVRSDILKMARRASDPAVARVLNKTGEAILKGIENNPAMRRNAQALKDYQTARAFTKAVHDLFGDKSIARIFDKTAGKYDIDDATAAKQLFGFGDKGGRERVPGQVAKIGQVMGKMEQWWKLLNHPDFDPTRVTQARDELITGARDYIIRNLTDTFESATRDISGQHNVIWHRLADWIEANRDWVMRSKLFTRDQLQVMDDLHHDAVVAAKTQDLRGGKGSESYERLLRDSSIIRLFASPLFRAGAGGLGALIGSMFGGLGEAGIGALLGLGAENVGEHLLQRLYAVPRQQLITKVEEALRDPDLTHELRQKFADGKWSPKAIAWMRSVIAAGIPGAAASADTERQHR